MSATSESRAPLAAGSRPTGAINTRPLHVAMLSPVTPAHGRGGVQDLVGSTARGLAARGCSVDLVTSAHPDGKREEMWQGVGVHYLDAPARDLALFGLNARWMRESLACVRSVNARAPIDVIHSQSYCGLHLVGVFPGVPVVTSLHGTHVDELRTRWGLIRSKLPAHPLAALKVSAQWGLMAARYVREAPRLRLSEAVIATSREQHVILQTRYRIPAERLHDVWNGIDTELFLPRAADPALRTGLGAGVNAPLVIAVARLYEEKGIHFAMRAWPMVLTAIPAATFVIVGDGPERPALETLAASLGIGDRVRFTGSVALESLPALYAASDAFINPTVRINGYDLTILQAMAMARPVVVSNIGSVPTAVRDGEDGFLVPPGDVCALASAIVRALRDTERSRAVAGRARRTVEERFSLESMVSGTLAVYERARTAMRVAR